MIDARDSDLAAHFREVLEDERQFLGLPCPPSAQHARVETTDAVSTDAESRSKPPKHFSEFAAAGAGLALSGGGIRSATFSLGVLQALASEDKLRTFDYLSSVSGGGYIASWLSAWIHREKEGITDVTKALARTALQGDKEPEQVQWLRRYSNYLTPRVGALSMDALTVGITWARNVFLNLIILVACVSALLLIPMLSLWPASYVATRPTLFAWIALGLALVSLSVMAWNLAVNYFEGPSPNVVDASNAYSGLLLLKPRSVIIYSIIPGFLSCIFASFWILTGSIGEAAILWVPFLCLVLFLTIVGGCWKAALLIDQRNRNLDASRAAEVDAAKTSLGTLGVYLASIVVAIYVCAGLLASVHNIGPRWLFNPLNSCGLGALVPVLTLGPPLVMACCGIAMCIWIGLVGRAFREPSREWLSRGGAALFLASVIWLVWFGLAFYVPRGVDTFLDASHPWLKSLGTLSWLGSLIGSALMASLNTKSKQRPLRRWQSVFISVLTSIAAIGIFVLIAWALQRVLFSLPSGSSVLSTSCDAYWARYDDWTGLGSPWDRHLLAIAFLALVLIAVGFAARVDINRFSLHNMYKNRLIRAYLGASNKKRCAQPFTGFDPTDDVALKDLAQQRPLHIINVALNLVQGSELAWQQRKAASFVFTPRHCGFELSAAQGNRFIKGRHASVGGYRSTSVYATRDEDKKNQGFTLGMAVATSGAAVSPNMGVQSQPALAVLLTFLDIRLGRWSANPAKAKFMHSSPRFGLYCLLKELIGNTNEDSNYVYLSDGGHFENMAVYELIRRKCRRIVVVDAGADPQRSFEDLGNLFRKCRVDFGVEIELALGNLYGCDTSTRSKQGFQFGKIWYGGRQGARDAEGEILLIKPSLCTATEEPADIYNYAAQETDFPQQTTLDQWFDESQFESYRQLGFALAKQALAFNPNFL